MMVQRIVTSLTQPLDSLITSVDIPNHGFENGFDGWNLLVAGRTETGYGLPEGDNYAYVYTAYYGPEYPSYAVDTLNYENLQCTPGETYQLKFYMNQFGNYSKNLYAMIVFPDVSQSFKSPIKSGVSGFQPVTFDFTAPAGSDGVFDLQFWSNNSYELDAVSINLLN